MLLNNVVTLGYLLKLNMPWFPYLSGGDNNNTITQVPRSRE